VQSSAGVIKNSYLTKEESFMYDREGRFRMEDTMNAARIEYTEKAVMHMAARRCDVIRISQTEAVLALLTKYNLPNQFYLDIPDARITKIGCVMLRPHFRVQHASGAQGPEARYPVFLRGWRISGFRKAHPEPSASASHPALPQRRDRCGRNRISGWWRTSRCRPVCIALL
jgi:hypothetical protein